MFASLVAFGLLLTAQTPYIDDNINDSLGEHAYFTGGHGHDPTDGEPEEDPDKTKRD